MFSMCLAGTRFEVELLAGLVIYCPNVYEPAKGKVLLAGGMIPSADVEKGEHPSVTAARILHDATGIVARTGPGTSGWVDFHPAGFYLRDNYVVMLYAAHLPDCVPLRSVYEWVQLDGVHQDMLPIIIDSLRRI